MTIAQAHASSVLELLDAPESNPAKKVVLDAFRAEYEAAMAIAPPAGWSFTVKGRITQPNLMQRHFASLVVARRTVGNFSGTGAGKTISAILAARVLDCGRQAKLDADDQRDGLIVVIAPNNTLSGWARTVQDCYPDNQVETKRLAPIWSGTGPKWLIVNFEALQQPAAKNALAQLLETYRIDMLVMDEIHFVKQRYEGKAPTSAEKATEVKESKRRENLREFRVNAERHNAGLYVLGMSATPVVNNLVETKSILELTTGIALDDVETRSTIANAMAVHRHMVRTGVRWMPDYDAKLGAPQRPRVEIDHLLPELLALGKNPGSPLAIEQILIEAKIPVIVEACLAAKRQNRKVLIYTEYVQGIVTPIHDALTRHGLQVGTFTGEDKTGLDSFLGDDRTGAELRKIPLDEQADVLIGSSTVGTGVDGLQHVCDMIIFATLPWTSAGWTQIVGRVWRQGQKAKLVEVVIPTTGTDVEIDGESTRWSFCDHRWARITFKKTIADAAMDGIIPTVGQLGTPNQFANKLMEDLLDDKLITQKIGEWHDRLRSGDTVKIERRALQADLMVVEREADADPSGAGRQRRYSEFSGYNARWNTSASKTTHARLKSDRAEWDVYHRLYREARQSWDVVPAHVFADWLTERPNRQVADLGCGEMILADRAGAGHTVTGFDHVAFDGRVTSCDIAHLPVADQSFDIAVLSLALMGANDSDYLLEARRILRLDGQLWLAEPTSRIGSDSERIGNVLQQYGFRLGVMEVRGRFTILSATKLKMLVDLELPSLILSR